jgi:hypothetical protein
MTDDAFKAAEKRGYSKGYEAGKRRKVRQIDSERAYKEKQAFRRRAFLAALPGCINADGWKTGDIPITSLAARTALAWNFADEALKNAGYFG